MSELEKLQQLFGKYVITSSTNHDSSSYLWYCTTQGEEIGVCVSSLSSSEQKLLEIFLSPLPHHSLDLTEAQQYWKQLLFDNNGHVPIEPSRGRILLFHIKTKEVGELAFFEEAFKNMFPTEVTMVWKDTYSGVVIEPEHSGYTPAEEIRELLQTIESDTYKKIYVFIGSSFESYSNAKTAYDKEAMLFDSLLQVSTKEKVFTLSSSLPFLLLSGMNKQNLTYIRQQLLNDVDPVLIHTVKTLLECNLNYTVAARQLFIHRNSLQYRMEKFSELTGLDLKNFSQAVSAFLLL